MRTYNKEQGKVVLVVSLDVRDAFNILLTDRESDKYHLQWITLKKSEAILFITMIGTPGLL